MTIRQHQRTTINVGRHDDGLMRKNDTQADIQWRRVTSAVVFEVTEHM